MMKKILSLLLCAVFIAASCGAASAKSIVIYFSMPETDKAENMSREEDNSTVVIDGKVLGNVQYIAQVIQLASKADIFRIEPKTPYTTNHADLITFAREEQRRGARPELKTDISDLEQYDTIFLGYPNWWADMPMILYTFLEAHDLSGKNIIPFVAHGGSGFSSTVRTIAKLQPKANIYQNGLSIYRDRVQNSEQNIINWVKDLGYLK